MLLVAGLNDAEQKNDQNRNAQHIQKYQNIETSRRIVQVIQNTNIPATNAWNRAKHYKFKHQDTEKNKKQNHEPMEKTWKYGNIKTWHHENSRQVPVVFRGHPGCIPGFPTNRISSKMCQDQAFMHLGITGWMVVARGRKANRPGKRVSEQPSRPT